ncbi:MAG: orotidine-5'-phosphate decarboxylase [Gammaproteobacteria bacterium]
MNNSPIIVALDYADPAKALVLLGRLDPKQCRVKIGKELFCRGGPALVEETVKLGFDVFLDLKFHDIPNTVAQACSAAAELGVWMINVHALGGRKMMEAARAAINAKPKPPLLIAVTILTSLDADDLREIGLSGTPQENVMRLAALAKQAGMDGVVCSPWEASALRATHGKAFRLITPGVRPQGADKGDQKRIMTPREAIQNGADYLVIGRPITAAAEPSQVLRNIQDSLGGSGDF